MSRLIRFRQAVALIAYLLGGTASGYYHFTHYPGPAVPFTPLVEKFDLDDLVDRTVYFHVSSEAPRLAPNDSYEAVVSQIRQALAVWNSVPTSALRVAYGGIDAEPLVSQSPGGEIIFAELPPGVIGLGGPVTRADPEDGFVPIIRSQVILSNDLTQGSRPRPSFSEIFFTSLVHEIGHALGLQHTLTSSVMSTEVTRATTRALPLGADDIAGLSVLYPLADFFELHGSLAGKVTNRVGEAVSLASVVAVGPNGQVVSALTAPDGAYRIDGLLPGPYLVYVHPLPPGTQQGLGPANIVLPATLAGERLAPSGPFKTIFYGGTSQPAQSAPLEVAAASVTDGVDLQVEPRADQPLYSITTFSFPGNGAGGVHPAFLDVTAPAGFILATGPGLIGNAARVTVESLEGDLEVRPPTIYDPDPRFVRIDFAFTPLTRLEPKHLLFRVDDDIYLLPSGVRLTSRPAPIIHWIAPSVDQQGQSIWIVRGLNFDPRSTVYFDGWPAAVVSFDPEQGEIGVKPPEGPPGRVAVVTVYNPDGQSSAFTLPDGNIMFPFEGAASRSLTLSPPTAQIDSDVVIEIEGTHTRFVAGDTVVGFGTSDVVTREIHVLSPSKAVAVVTVRKDAVPGTYTASVTTGLEVLQAPGGFRVTKPSGTGDAPQVRFKSLVNSATMQPKLSPGVLASLFGGKLTVGDDTIVRVTFNGQPATLLSVTERQINLQIPWSAGLGTAVLEVHNGLATSDPMLVHLDTASPGIFGVINSKGRFVDADHPPSPGETLALLATGLGSPAPEDLDASVRVTAGQQPIKPLSIESVARVPGLYSIRFQAPEAGAFFSSVFVWAGSERSNVLQLPVTPLAVQPSRMGSAESTRSVP